VQTNNPPSTAPSRPSTWARSFAALYDPSLWLGERRGVRTQRQDLLGAARGRTLEIGGGTGLNLAHYPDDLEHLVITEPDPSMRARLGERVRRSGRRAELVDAPAERLPFPDGSIDTVVSTFVLCTVDDPYHSLREIARVLRPDGQLLFLEHVRAASPRLASWQDRFADPWRRFARGCRCNRPTTELLAASGFTFERATEARWRGMPPIVRPLIVGRASPTDGSAA
jgi:ubiquinone/menaquinone biosynthesis C-methylase UbiE